MSYPQIWFSWCAKSTWGDCGSPPGPACHNESHSLWGTAAEQTEGETTGQKYTQRHTVIIGVRILCESVGLGNLEGTLGIMGYFTSWCAIFRFNFTAFMSTFMSRRKISEIPLPKFVNRGCGGLETSFKTFMSGSKMFFIDEIREM